MTSLRLATVASAVVASAFAAAPAGAQSVADFYRGATIRMIIRTGPGGTYDLYSRLLAKHMSAHIPGQPAIINVNMPGGGGIVAANYVGKLAPRDGTVISIIGVGLSLEQALGLNPSFQADLREFGWLGSVSSSNQVTVVWHGSPVKSLDDARRVVTQLGSSGAGSVSQQYPAFYNAFLGTKFKIVYGYPGSPQINLAMERGELDGAGSNGWAQSLIETPHYVREKWITPLIQTGLRKEPDLPDTPLLLDLARNEEERAAFRFMSNAVEFGRPVATPPGAPAERLAALREAFEKTVRDPAFLDDVRRAGVDARPANGAAIEKIVRDLIEAPEALRARVKTAIGGG